MNAAILAKLRELEGSIFLDAETNEPVWGDVLMTFKHGRLALTRVTRQYVPTPATRKDDHERPRP